MFIHPRYLEILQYHPFPHALGKQLDNDGLLPVYADTGLLVGNCTSSEKDIGAFGEI